MGCQGPGRRYWCQARRHRRPRIRSCSGRLRQRWTHSAAKEDGETAAAFSKVAKLVLGLNGHLAARWLLRLLNARHQQRSPPPAATAGRGRRCRTSHPSRGLPAAPWASSDHPSDLGATAACCSVQTHLALGWVALGRRPRLPGAQGDGLELSNAALGPAGRQERKAKSRPLQSRHASSVLAGALAGRGEGRRRGEDAWLGMGPQLPSGGGWRCATLAGAGGERQRVARLFAVKIHTPPNPHAVQYSSLAPRLRLVSCSTSARPAGRSRASAGGWRGRAGGCRARRPACGSPPPAVCPVAQLEC